jgi:hypothetical protein
MLQLSEMDDRVPLADQLTQEVGPVILINTFRVAPEDIDALLEARYPDSTVASPHLFQKVAVLGICVDR